STIKLETVHTMSVIFLSICQIGMFAYGDVAKGTVAVALNVLVNLYPIFMQRANRYDLLNAKKRKLAILEKVQESNNSETHNSNF
ncbi:MAG: hypothetical protein Q7R33_03955, partial [Nitrosarchaeum sp.]|nr:hypothetical protein [Nitrosarchaeum sp.]